jgi:hypothetical protein
MEVLEQRGVRELVCWRLPAQAAITRAGAS